MHVHGGIIASPSSSCLTRLSNRQLNNAKQGGACRLLEEKSLLQEEDSAQQAVAPRLLGGVGGGAGSDGVMG